VDGCKRAAVDKLVTSTSLLAPTAACVSLRWPRWPPDSAARLRESATSATHTPHVERGYRTTRWTTWHARKCLGCVPRGRHRRRRLPSGIRCTGRSWLRRAAVVSMRTVCLPRDQRRHPHPPQGHSLHPRHSPDQNPHPRQSPRRSRLHSLRQLSLLLQSGLNARVQEARIRLSWSSWRPLVAERSSS